MEESIMFQGHEVDQGERSCPICGQSIKDMRKALEVEDSGILIHAACHKAEVERAALETSPVEAQASNRLCWLCSHTVGQDAIGEQLGTSRVYFHPRCHAAFQAATDALAGRMRQEAATRTTLTKAAEPKQGYGRVDWVQEIDGFMRRHDG